MLERISRIDCIEKYSFFPLREYDANIGDEKIIYPQIHSHYWLKIDDCLKSDLKEKLAVEIDKICDNLNIRKILFLCDVDSTWVTRNARTITDNKDVINAIQYFEKNGIGLDFNGALLVDKSELKIFILHFFTLTVSDASFSDFYFIDENETILGFIHYSGEVQIDTLSECADKKFLNAIKLTNFIDSFRKNTNRI